MLLLLMSNDFLCSPSHFIFLDLFCLQSSSPASTRAVLGGEAVQRQPPGLRGFPRGPEEEEARTGHVLRTL